MRGAKETRQGKYSHKEICSNIGRGCFRAMKIKACIARGIPSQIPKEGGKSGGNDRMGSVLNGYNWSETSGGALYPFLEKKHKAFESPTLPRVKPRSHIM